ncbi:MAG: hypothetical protein CL878_00945 [Dehalococcoidia bacterium]|nr:hypothetical protein [Dehalococcoidia bacterium]
MELLARVHWGKGHHMDSFGLIGFVFGLLGFIMAGTTRRQVAALSEEVVRLRAAVEPPDPDETEDAGHAEEA